MIKFLRLVTGEDLVGDTSYVENGVGSVLFDIADDVSWKSHENTTLKHFKERLRIYSEEKFKFKIYNVNLNHKG